VGRLAAGRFPIALRFSRLDHLLGGHRFARLSEHLRRGVQSADPLRLGLLLGPRSLGLVGLQRLSRLATLVRQSGATDENRIQS
jgi:hypothetical protein